MAPTDALAQQGEANPNHPTDRGVLALERLKRAREFFLKRLDRVSHAIDAGVDLGFEFFEVRADFGESRVCLGLEFLEVRADRRRHILAGGVGDIGDRVGGGQRVGRRLRHRGDG